MNDAMVENKGNLVEADEPFVAIKAESGKWLRMPRAPNLLRRGARGAVIYALSYMLVNALDKAHKENPDNQIVYSADEIAQAFFYFENLIVSGAVAVVKTGYNALSSAHSPSGEGTSTPVPPLVQKDAATQKAEPKRPLKHKPQPTRANLNSALASDASPVVTGSEPSTGISGNVGRKPIMPIIQPPS